MAYLAVNVPLILPALVLFNQALSHTQSQESESDAPTNGLQPFVAPCDLPGMRLVGYLVPLSVIRSYSDLSARAKEPGAVVIDREHSPHGPRDFTC